MVARYQFSSVDVLSQEDDLSEGIRQLWNKLRRSASVSRQPIDHPGVGGVVVALPRRAVVIGFPVCMGEASGVLVMRIAGVGVLEGCLRERKQQARHYTQME